MAKAYVDLNHEQQIGLSTRERAGVAYLVPVAELTALVAEADPEAAGTTLTDLRRLGVHLAIGDFGTGYSLIACLRRFPVEALRIDRSFVQDVGGERGE